MKPVYLIIIIVVVIIAIAIFVNMKNKANAAAAQAALANTNSGYTTATNQGGSQVAQVISALFPFFQTGINSLHNCPTGYHWDSTQSKCIADTTV